MIPVSVIGRAIQTISEPERYVVVLQRFQALYFFDNNFKGEIVMRKQNTRIEKLSDEILESQKTRTNLLRWKLIICAILGAAGLGLGEYSKSTYTLLALIPLACVYVDLLCANTNLRIILIGRYLAWEKDSYESFVGRHRIVFCLEDWALYGSTYVISILLFIFSLFRLITNSLHKGNFLNNSCVLESITIIATCIITIVLLKWIINAYNILLNHREVCKGEDEKKIFLKKLSIKNPFLGCLIRFLSKEKSNDKKHRDNSHS